MIGAGIVTFNRENFFINCVNSITNVDFLVVINDGRPYSKNTYTSIPNLIIEHKTNLGVAKSKNEIIRILTERSCDHIFLIEDDVAIKNAAVFDHYIKTAESTGIFHLNFAFHGDGNRDLNGAPSPRIIVKNNESASITLSKNLLGAFSYYHSSIIKKYGLLDENYINGLEHVDHTYQIIKGGNHPPFWWFADAPHSEKYIMDQDAGHKKSIIRRNKIRWKFNMFKNLRYFKLKNGIYPSEIPDIPEEIVLKEIDMFISKKPY